MKERPRIPCCGDVAGGRKRVLTESGNWDGLDRQGGQTRRNPILWADAARVSSFAQNGSSSFSMKAVRSVCHG